MEKSEVKNDIYKRVVKVIIDVMQIDENIINPETNIKEDLKAESLDIIQIFFDLEEEFESAIKDDEIKHLSTVGFIVDFILDKIENTNL